MKQFIIEQQMPNLFFHLDGQFCDGGKVLLQQISIYSWVGIGQFVKIVQQVVSTVL